MGLKPGMVARRFLVSGRVQGVGYRYFASRAGTSMRLDGWVRNLPDGRVEAYAHGAAQKLDAFAERLRKGPSASHVRSVEVLEEVVDARIEGFHIR